MHEMSSSVYVTPEPSSGQTARIIKMSTMDIRMAVAMLHCIQTTAPSSDLVVMVATTYGVIGLLPSLIFLLTAS